MPTWRRTWVLVEHVVLGDSLLKAGVARLESLIESAAIQQGPGGRRARAGAAFVRRGVDSPMESRLRMLLVLAGLPEPVINHEIRWHDGGLRYRFDLCYPEHKVIIEYDGRQHAESTQQWDHDIDRREWIDSDGWRIVVVRARDLYPTPGRTLGRVTGAMRAQGMVVSVLTSEWRRHFPSRAGDLDPR